MDNTAILNRARQVIDIEIEGLKRSSEALDEGFAKAVCLLYETLENGGKIVVTGVGKNLHMAEKFSATLASTGSVSVVMNPIQAMHGDLGIVTENDILVALSFSGESEEVVKLIPAVRRLGLKVIAMVGKPDCTLASLSDAVLPVYCGKEACPFGMAPTASTTATLAVADAVAMVLIDMHHFKKENYAKLHPAGAIGKALLLRVVDIMRTGENLAVVNENQTVMDAIMAMTKAKAGSSIVINDEGKLAGIFTDGDFRRNISNGLNDFSLKIKEIMTKNPVSVRNDLFAVDVLKVFESRKIDDLPVIDENGLVVGYIDIQDLPKMKVL